MELTNFYNYDALTSYTYNIEKYSGKKLGEVSKNLQQFNTLEPKG